MKIRTIEKLIDRVAKAFLIGLLACYVGGHIMLHFAMILLPIGETARLLLPFLIIPTVFAVVQTLGILMRFRQVRKWKRWRR